MNELAKIFHMGEQRKLEIVSRTLASNPSLLAAR